MIIHDYFGRDVHVEPWDGTTPGGRHYGNANELYTDAAGNIWYTCKDKKGRAAIWCSASRLEQHVHHLQQIAAR